MIFTHNISAVLFSFGPIELRWYGLLFAMGIMLSYSIAFYIFKKEKFKLADLESLIIWLFVGVVIGARLGHVFFYDAALYLKNPVEILKIWKGGLASHGAAIGIFIAYFSWCKMHKVKFSKYINFLVIPMPIAAAFVRLGNFFNSEILGYPTNSSYGVVFKKVLENGVVESFPRHPVQLYSMLMNLLVFVILFYLYKNHKKSTQNLNMMFIYVLLYFSGRFIVEFWKDLQGPIPESFGITTGQFLSVIPISLALFYFAWNRYKTKVQVK